MDRKNEVWLTIDEFPDYAVSNQGRVINKRTDLIKTPSLNQQGIPNVNLLKDGKQHRRSVAVLVADIFLPIPMQNHFDTPINLDGDRLNNSADNLAWRPRWFAVKFHQQFRRPPYQFTAPIICLDTGEFYDNPRHFAMRYGVLETELVRDLANKNGVFPQGYKFDLMK